MPELPEVETVARTLRPQIVGKRIAALTVLLPKALNDGHPHQGRLTNAVIETVDRRAKILLVHLRDGGGEPLALAFHLKMTGRFFLHPPMTAPLKHTRLIFDLTDGNRLFFDDSRTFGWCRILEPDDFARWPFWTALGPEPLDTTAAALAAHLKTRLNGRKRAIKAALLDQEIIAGLGNIYVDEALFKARIAPATLCGQVGDAALHRLSAAIQDVLRLAIAECGSSIRDYRDAAGNAGAFQNRFAVYGRSGQACITCSNGLTTSRIGGRTTVSCPHCQSG